MNERVSFWRDGACVVRAAAPAALIATVARAIDLLTGPGDLADLSALAGSSEPARFSAGVDHWRVHPAFAAIATTSALPHVVADVLGTDRLWLYEDSVLVKDAGTSVATRWHTDDGYFHVDGEQLATLWLPVDPAPLSAGALRFVAGSHMGRERYRPTLFVTDDVLPDTEGSAPPDLAFDDPRVIGFDLELGDLTIHHSRTLHASGGNQSSLPRRALSVRYCGIDAVVRVKPGVPAKPGFDADLNGVAIADAATRLGLLEVDLSRAPRIR